MIFNNINLIIKIFGKYCIIIELIEHKIESG
jgi:hypothetical protein